MTVKRTQQAFHAVPVKRGAPFAAAVVLSLLAHALTLGGGWLRLPQSEPEPRALTATLVPMQPAPSAPAALPRSLAKPAKPAPVRVAAARPPAAPATVPMITARDTDTPPAIVDAGAPAETAADAAAPAADATPAMDPVVVATAAPTTLAIAPIAPIAPALPAAIRTLPPRGRISYNLNYYLSGLPVLVGSTQQSWEMSGDSYRINSRSQTVGLARFTRFGPRVYASSGTVTAQGLKPREFASSVTVRGALENAAARFDWDAQQLQFGELASPKNAALPQGAQDFISFMYQLSLAPLASTGERIQIPITNGSRFETHEFIVRAEEILETPLGALRVVPVVQVRRPNTESMEVWLAAEYNYLPVRIRFIGRDGEAGGEQIVTDIRVGAN